MNLSISMSIVDTKLKFKKAFICVIQLRIVIFFFSIIYGQTDIDNGD